MAVIQGIEGLEWAGLTWPRLLGAAVALYMGYAAVIVIYRLYFSPLAKFPGPKLPVITNWYETYFDIFKGEGGQFMFDIKKMHEKYGPIVRINAEELHIDDPEFYEVIYATSKPYDRLLRFTKRFNVELSVAGTADSATHKVRRAAVLPFFSKARVRQYNRHIQEVLNRISHRLSTEFAGTDAPVDLNCMWGALTADVVMDMMFARPGNYAEAPGFQSRFVKSTKAAFATVHVMGHFSFLYDLMLGLPPWLVKRMSPQAAPMVQFYEDMSEQVSDVIAGKNHEAKNSSHTTIFHEILNSRLPPREKTHKRLHCEANALVGAGVETTRWCLMAGTTHILSNPDVEACLVAELVEAMPDPSRILTWAELEQLPYLNACVQESLRLAIGVTQRLPRVNWHGAWQYGDWVIPPGTPVSMDSWHMHMNPTIFPEPARFKPQRWLDPEAKLANVNGRKKPLSNYLVSFSRGTRMCIGLHIAQAEIFVGLATIFRRHKLELFETDLSDVTPTRDMMVPHPPLASKGVKVRVKA